MINFFPVAYAQVVATSSLAANIAASAAAQMARIPTVIYLVVGIPLAFWFADFLIDKLQQELEDRHSKATKILTKEEEMALTLHKIYEEVQKQTGIHTGIDMAALAAEVRTSSKKAQTKVKQTEKKQ